MFRVAASPPPCNTLLNRPGTAGPWTKQVFVHFWVEGDTRQHTPFLFLEEKKKSDLHTAKLSLIVPDFQADTWGIFRLEFPVLLTKKKHADAYRAATFSHTFPELEGHQLHIPHDCKYQPTSFLPPWDCAKKTHNLQNDQAKAEDDPLMIRELHKMLLID